MMPLFSRTLLCGLLASTSFVGTAWADDASSVQVATITPHRETVPVYTEAFGSIMPSSNGVIALVQPLDGWVRKLDSTPGQSVKAGDPVLEWTAAANIVSAFEQAGSAVTLSLAQLQHTRALLGQHLATQDQVDQATKAVSDAQANYDALKSEGGDRRAIIIKAPTDGVVTAIPVMQGQKVVAGTPLAMFATLGGLVATVGIEPASVAAVHLGAAVVLTALNSNAVVQGHVIRVDSSMDPLSRLVSADIAFEADAQQVDAQQAGGQQNGVQQPGSPPAASTQGGASAKGTATMGAPATGTMDTGTINSGTVKTGALMNGTDVSAKITVGTAEGWAVPHGAIQYDAQGSYIMQAVNQHAARVGVTLRHEAGDTDIVDGAIDPTHPVITSGSYQLSNGDAIRSAPAAASGSTTSGGAAPKGKAP